jgi:hypothetical protein
MRFDYRLSEEIGKVNSSISDEIAGVKAEIAGVRVESAKNHTNIIFAGCSFSGLAR